MHTGLFGIVLVFIILFMLYIPDIFPKCSCCRKKKLRPFFRIHRAVSINPGYGGSRSVCTKCCRKYNIEDLKDLDHLILVQKKLKLDSLVKNLFS